MTATSYHRGDAYLSYHLLLVGADFPTVTQFQNYCDATISSLWAIAPFAMARSALSIWVVEAEASMIARDAAGRIAGLDPLAVRSIVGEMQNEDPAVPPWSAWTDGMKLRAGVVVCDFLDPGYEGLLGSSAPATDSLARRMPIGSSWSDSGSPSAQAFVTMAGLPFGGSHIPDDLNAYRATAGQLAKAIGLLLRLGDELAVGSATFEGSVGELPLNLDSPPLYPVDPMRTDNGTGRGLSPQLMQYWRLRGDRSGNAFKIVSGSTLEVRSFEVAVVHASLGLIPDSPLIAPSGVAAMLNRGVHLVEGGGGYRFGVYRAQADCIMRFPWRYDETASRWTPAAYCPVCRQQVQRILVGYGDYRLGQFVVDAGSIDEDADRDLGALLAQQVAAEGGEQPALADFARSSSRLAALARISQFFGTQTRLNKGRPATFHVVAGDLELVDEVPEGEDAVRLPMIRNAFEPWAEVFWASNYNAVFPEMYPDAERRVLTLLVCGGIAAGIEAFGLGEGANERVDDGALVRWATLDAERAQTLRPGAVIELFAGEDAAVSAVEANTMASLPEGERRTLILVERTDDGVRLADQTSSDITDDAELSSLRSAYGYVIGANWYGYSRGIRTGDARTGAEIKSAETARQEVVERLSQAARAEADDIPYFPTEEGSRTLADYISSGDYYADVSFLIERIKRRALSLVRLPIPIIEQLLEQLRERYIAEDVADIADTLDDLAFGLGLLLPDVPYHREMVSLAEHLDDSDVIFGPASRLVGAYSEPPTEAVYPEMLRSERVHRQEAFASALVYRRGLALSDEDAWVFVRNRHPILFLLQRWFPGAPFTRDAVLSRDDYDAIVEMITPDETASLAENLTTRRTALSEWVRDHVESVESGIAKLTKALKAAAKSKPPPAPESTASSLHDAGTSIFGLQLSFSELLTDNPPDAWDLFRKALLMALEEEVPGADYPELFEVLKDVYLAELSPGIVWDEVKETLAPAWIAVNVVLLVALLASRFGAARAGVAAEPLAAAASRAAAAELTVLEVTSLGVEVVDLFLSLNDLKNALADEGLADINRVRELNDFVRSKGLDDLSVIRSVNEDVWDEALFLGASAIGLWLSLASLWRAGRIPPRTADGADPPPRAVDEADVPPGAVDEADVPPGALDDIVVPPPTLTERLTARRLLEEILSTQKSLSKAMRRKTLSTDRIKTLSGWAARFPAWITRNVMMNAEAVRTYAASLDDYVPTVHKFFDHGTPGLFAASHAEKQLALFHALEGAVDPIAVSKLTCGDCRRFLRALAQKEGQRVLVADPKYVRSYQPDGSVLVYDLEGTLLRTVEEGVEPGATLRGKAKEIW